MANLFSVEGIDGSGKSTQIRLIESYLKTINLPVLVTREPGGTILGEAIRSIVKYPWLVIPEIEKIIKSNEELIKESELMANKRNKNISSECEMFLFLASRAQFFKEIVKPALDSGKYVFVDRLHDSTRAYQGGGRFKGDPAMRKFINLANQIAMLNIKPKATFFIDVSIETSRQRINLCSSGKVATFEKEHDEFFTRVRQEYLLIAQEEPERFIVIDGERRPEEIFEDIKKYLQRLI